MWSAQSWTAAQAAAATTAVDRLADHGVEGNNMEPNWMTEMILQLPLAQEKAESSMHLLGEHLLAAILFSVVGIVVFSVCLFIMEKITPFSILKEIGEEHNQAVAMIVSAIVLGISIIIAASILG